MRALLLGLALLGGVPDGEEAQVAVLAHPVARGETVVAEDFVLEPRGAAIARGAMRAEDAAGMEAVRNLSAGAVVRRGDLVAPRLVRRGEPVSIRLVAGPLTITAAGRALGSAGQGESVRVVTDTTSRTLDGVVDGAGSVRVRMP